MQNIISYENKQLFHREGKKNLEKFFDKSVISRLSVKSGFSVRRARKISAYAFVVGFIECSLKRSCSYGQWAAAIGRLCDCSVSKQSLWERIDSGASAFAECLLKHVMCTQVSKAWNKQLFAGFRRVLLQDSTALSLPARLVNYFPGNVSRGIQNAVARIQCIIELKAMRFMHFSLSGYTQNDQSACHQADAYVDKNDLVIRDLGYFALHALQVIADKHAYFLSRLRYNVKMYDQLGNPLLLSRLLRNYCTIDQWVYIGEKQRLPVRLIMIPLSDQQIAERIRKARHDRDKRLHHSPTYYQWLRFAVFITNVDQQVWTAEQVAQAYKLRWQIEVIFKSWKSSFNLQYILREHCGNVHRIITAILLMLVFICLFMQNIYLRYKSKIEKTKGKIVSLLKLSGYAAGNLYFFLGCNSHVLLEQIDRHCCYEKRSDRTNMTDSFKLFKILS